MIFCSNSFSSCLLTSCLSWNAYLYGFAYTGMSSFVLIWCLTALVNDKWSPSLWNTFGYFLQIRWSSLSLLKCSVLILSNGILLFSLSVTSILLSSKCWSVSNSAPSNGSSKNSSWSSSA